MQWRERLRLYYVDQTLAHELENCNESHRDAHSSLFGTEQVHEFYETGLLEGRENIAHPLAD